METRQKEKTPEDEAALRRQQLIEQGRVFVGQNAQKFQTIIEGIEGNGDLVPRGKIAIVTVAFDNRCAFKFFVDYIFDSREGRGIGPTNLPVPNSCRVSPDLLTEVGGKFNLRPVSDEEYQKGVEKWMKVRKLDEQG